VYFLYPETMGRSLEELEMMFIEGNSILDIVSESKKPLTGGLMPARMMENGKADVDYTE
jgi:hypothetical protein